MAAKSIPIVFVLIALVPLGAGVLRFDWRLTSAAAACSFAGLAFNLLVASRHRRA
jgi:hypothetical protein